MRETSQSYFKGSHCKMLSLCVNYWMLSVKSRVGMREKDKSAF